MRQIYYKFKEILKHRYLLWHLAGRELKIKYKYPLLGFLWMLFIPLSMVVIFKIIFSIILRIDVPGIPFFIYLTTGIFPWAFFSSSLSSCINCLVDGKDLIKKVYFPREIVPLAFITSSLIAFVIMLFIIFIFILITMGKVSSYVYILPFVILMNLFFTIGLSLIFSCLQVFYRDIKYLLEIILIFWFYLTPIFYPLDLVQQVSYKFFFYYMLNPMTGIITFYRIAFLDGFIKTLPEEINLIHLAVYTLFICLFVFITGMYVFMKKDKKLSDFL